MNCKELDLVDNSHKMLYNGRMQKYESISVEILPDGTIILPKGFCLESKTSAILTILGSDSLEVSMLSEKSLSDWNNEEEDKAWKHLQ